MNLIFLLPYSVAAVATTLWTFVNFSWQLGVVIALAWLLAATLLYWLKPAMTIQAGVSAFVLFAVTFLNITGIVSDNKKDEDKNKQEEKNTEEVIAQQIDPEGTIVVEAGNGTLSNKGYNSYVAESARGLEAYLGDDLATVSYNVEIPAAAKYQLWVKLSDDGTWENGYRSADVYINDSQTLPYNHISEDTKGWKYYNLGTANLKTGSNKFDFIKRKPAYAAFTMDEFKLIPIKE